MEAAWLSNGEGVGSEMAMGRKMPSATERTGATEQRRQNRRIWADEWTLPMRILEGADIGYHMIASNFWGERSLSDGHVRMGQN